MNRVAVTVARDGRVTALSVSLPGIGACRATSIRYGRKDEVTFSPPKWPDLPVAARERLDPAAVLNLLSSLAAIMQPLSPARPAAPRPATK